MQLPVSRRRTVRHGFALAVLTITALPTVAQQRVPLAPSGTILEVQQRKEAASFDPLSVASVNKRLTRLRAIAKYRHKDPTTSQKTVQAFKPSSDGKMETVTVEQKKIPGTGWAGAQLHYLQQRAYPFDRLDPKTFIRAAEQRDRMPNAAVPLAGQARRANARKKNPPPQNSLQTNAVNPPNNDETPIITDLDEQTSSLRWEPMGPGGYNGGSVSWRVGGLAYDPFDFTGNTLYAATPKGGIWRTEDNGQSWQPLSDKEFSLSFSCIEVSPFDPDVLFAGTGDYHGGNGPGFGILKSTDRGQTWKNYGKVEFGTASIRRIMPHPIQPNIVFATAGRNGLLRSIDEGETWTQTLTAVQLATIATAATAGPDPTGVSNITFNSGFSTLYISIDNVGIYFSEDDGQTWTVMPGAPTGVGRFDVATSKLGSRRKQRTLYVMHGGAGGADGTISKGEPPIDNVDGTIAFTALGDSPRGNVGGRAVWDQKSYNFYIGTTSATVIDPGLPTATPPLGPYPVAQDVIYIGLIEVWVSVDSGALWQFVPTHHVDQHSITVSPFNRNELLMGSDGGVRKLNLIAQAINPFHTAQPMPAPPPVPNPWGPRRRYSVFDEVLPNNGLDIAQFYDAGFSPRNFSEAIGGTQDNGTQYSVDLINWGDVSGGDGGGTGINFLRPGIQYSSNQIQNNPDFYPINLSYPDSPDDPNALAWESAYNISIYTNGDINPFIANGTINAGNPEKFMYATNFLYEFDSTTFRWTKFRQRFSENGYVIGTAAAPSDPRYIYAGTLDGRFWYSSDGGRRFIRVNGLPNRSITDIQVSATNPRQVYVTLGGSGAGHVYRSNDVTRGNWANISNGLPDIHTSAIEVLPRNNGQEIFVGTDVGVFYTANGGQNWYNATRTMGLPNVDVRDITFMPQTGYLHIATFGRGMWRLPIMDGEVGAGRVLLRIQTYLDSYRGDKSQLTAQVEFISGNSVVATSNIRLTAAGYIIAPVELAGTFDIRVTIPGFLRKRAVDIYVGEVDQPALNITFINGNVDGNNVVDNADLSLVSAQLGRVLSGPVDVDGDGRITSNDIRIVQRNLGRRGDD